MRNLIQARYLFYVGKTNFKTTEKYQPRTADNANTSALLSR